jgi:Tol biopolymer transport system component
MVRNGKIAYTVHGQVWVMNADGTNPHAISGNICAENVSWSPDGRKIAFDNQAGSCAPIRGIYVMNADGSHVTALTNGACADAEPAWSPNGSRLVFRRVGLTTTCNNELWTMNANGQSQQQLTHDGVNANDQGPAWSPDGTKIAFARYSPMLQIYVLNLSTGTERNFDSSGYQDSDPDWSPDGRKITFTRTIPGLNNEVAVMDADGSNQIVLTNNYYGDYLPVWAPDGAKIAFAHSTIPVLEDGVYTMDPAGTNPINLGTGAIDGRFSWQPCHNACP